MGGKYKNAARYQILTEKSGTRNLHSLNRRAIRHRYTYHPKKPPFRTEAEFFLLMRKKDCSSLRQNDS